MHARRPSARCGIACVCARVKAPRARKCEIGAGQQARREVFGRWRGEQEGVWAREDVLVRLDGVAQQAFDRMLRVDEEPVVVVTNPNHEDEDVDALANLSTASRRRSYKRVYVRRKRAEARSNVAQLDSARLKLGRKATVPSKHSQRPPSVDNSTDNAEQKRRLQGTMRPYKVQRKLNELGIGPWYMRENALGKLGLFRLGVLWRLMRYVSTPSSHQIDAKLTTADCIPISTPRGPKKSRSSSLQVRFRHYTLRRAVRTRYRTVRPHFARTRLCAAWTGQDLAPRQTRSAPSTRPSRTTKARCVSR